MLLRRAAGGPAALGQAADELRLRRAGGGRFAWPGCDRRARGERGWRRAD